MLPLLFFIRCELFDNSDEQENSNIDYPTILTPLSETELSELQLELDSLLDTRYKATLDEYGLIGIPGLLSRGSSSITDMNDAISIAKVAYTRFSKFTNVTDTSLLVVKRATNQTGSIYHNDWIVYFENQKYDDIEVLNTGIFVLITDNTTQLSGHHYKDIFIPTKDRISLKNAEDTVLDMELIYLGFADADTFIVTEQSLHVENAYEEASIIILPYEKDDKIEMRVCWKIPIFMGSIYPDFYVFVDILSGYIITYWTLFIC